MTTVLEHAICLGGGGDAPTSTPWALDGSQCPEASCGQAGSVAHGEGPQNLLHGGLRIRNGAGFTAGNGISYQMMKPTNLFALFIL